VMNTNQMPRSFSPPPLYVLVGVGDPYYPLVSYIVAGSFRRGGVFKSRASPRRVFPLRKDSALTRLSLLFPRADVADDFGQPLQAIVLGLPLSKGSSLVSSGVQLLPLVFYAELCKFFLVFFFVLEC